MSSLALALGALLLSLALAAPLAAANPATDAVNAVRSAAMREVGKAQRAVQDAVPGNLPPPDPGAVVAAAKQAYGKALDTLAPVPGAALGEAERQQRAAEEAFAQAWAQAWGLARGALGA